MHQAQCQTDVEDADYPPTPENSTDLSVGAPVLTRCVLQENSELENFEDRRTPTSRMASFLKLSSSVPETVVALTPQRDTAQP